MIIPKASYSSTYSACQWCKQLLVFINGRGWVHRRGEGVYWIRCKDCKWEGSGVPSPKECPNCQSANLFDDHCANPVRT